MSHSAAHARWSVALIFFLNGVVLASWLRTSRASRRSTMAIGRLTGDHLVRAMPFTVSMPRGALIGLGSLAFLGLLAEGAMVDTWR